MTEPKPSATYATAADAEAAGGSELERTFETYWCVLASGEPAYEREYQFVADRRWRLDFAWPEPIKVYVECDGGTHSGGRHVTGTGYRGDCEKQNRAVAEGWLPFRFTSDMLRDDPMSCVLMVEAAINRRRG